MSEIEMRLSLRAAANPRGEDADLMLAAAGALAELRSALLGIRSGGMTRDEMVSAARGAIERYSGGT